jgi:hypothetical protein
MVSAIGIIPIALDLLWRDENVLPVFPPPGVDVAADVFDFSGVAIRIIAAAARGIIRHVPCRIKLLVQSLILRGMVVLRHCGRGYNDESRREVCPFHAPCSLSRTRPPLDAEPVEALLDNWQTIGGQEQRTKPLVSLKIEVRDRINSASPITVEGRTEPTLRQSLSSRDVLREQNSIAPEPTMVLPDFSDAIARITV